MLVVVHEIEPRCLARKGAPLLGGLSLDIAQLSVYLSLIVLVKEEFSVAISHSRLLFRQRNVAVNQRVPQSIRVEIGYDLPGRKVLLRLLPNFLIRSGIPTMNDEFLGLLLRLLLQFVNLLLISLVMFDEVAHWCVFAKLPRRGRPVDSSVAFLG